jgi:glycosyltransferase involved in cell wall biosynthesis
MSSIREFAIVVPARNEEALLARCLDSAKAAMRSAQDRLGPDAPAMSLTVVADACTDGTTAIASSFDDVRILEIEAHTVGTARAAGIELALAAVGSDTSGAWIANTDADSVVPPNWVLEQLALADAGIDVMIGTVRPDFADLSPAHIRAWRKTRHPSRANGHIHGANLGIRASRYFAAGGFAPLTEHEDVDLIDRCAALGDTTFATDACEVMTSGRHHGRTPGGYARYLRVDLLARAAATSPTVTVGHRSIEERTVRQ